MRRRHRRPADRCVDDLGKPRIEAYLSEVFFLKEEIRLFSRKLKQWSKPKWAKFPLYHFPIWNEIRREPFGRTLIIAPWNFPFQLALGPLVSAVGAGNCVTLKPSELAPATSECLAELLIRICFFKEESQAASDRGKEGVQYSIFICGQVCQPFLDETDHIVQILAFPPDAVIRTLRGDDERGKENGGEIEVFSGRPDPGAIFQRG